MEEKKHLKNGIVCSFKNTSKNYIIAYGNDVDGDIAAVKRIVSAGSIFLNAKNFPMYSVYMTYASLIDENDPLGISVTDLLRSSENKKYYSQRNSQQFKKVVSDVLNDNNFEIAIKTVKPTNHDVKLRTINVNTDFSANFRDAIVNISRPVIMSQGLWSDLFSWIDFGRELATDPNDARNVWLIEMTGGPNTECASCPNYTYNDLVDFYWPSLIAGVLKYSGQNNSDYVGFSNGCRVALDSLKNWSSTGKNNAGYYFDTVTGNYLLTNLIANPVNTFIGIGCPGAFNGTSFVINKVKGNPNTVAQLNRIGIIHPSFRDVAKTLTTFGFIFPERDRISLNLWDKYVSWILNNSDSQPGGGFSFNKFYIIYGVGGLNGVGNEQDDGTVTVSDELSIANNVISSNANKTFEYKQDHSDLPDDKHVRNKIKELLAAI